MSLQDHLSDEEFRALEGAANLEVWSALCAQIKKNRGGKYPYDWFPRVIQGGLLARKATEWGDPSLAEIKITRVV